MPKQKPQPPENMFLLVVAVLVVAVIAGVAGVIMNRSSNAGEVNRMQEEENIYYDSYKAALVIEQGNPDAPDAVEFRFDKLNLLRDHQARMTRLGIPLRHPDAFKKKEQPK